MLKISLRLSVVLSRLVAFIAKVGVFPTLPYERSDILYFHVSFCRRMLAMLAWQRSGTGDACQIGKMATLSNSLFYMFKNSLLSKYCVKYCDYMVKWCSGRPIACNWCVSGYCSNFSFNMPCHYSLDMLLHLKTCPSHNNFLFVILCTTVC